MNIFTGDPAGTPWPLNLVARLDRGRRTAHSTLPDIAVVLGAEDSTEIRFLNRAPHLVVEIRSPDDPLAWSAPVKSMMTLPTKPSRLG